MRNKETAKGGSALKKKILNNEAYVYGYVSVSEWNLVTD
jgi:hypothetical protein